MAIPWGTGALTPSISGRYAHSKSESARPELWDGLVGFWAPALGPTGATMYDVSGRPGHGAIAGGPTWSVGVKGTELRWSGAGAVTVPYSVALQPTLPLSIAISLRLTSLAATNLPIATCSNIVYYGAWITILSNGSLWISYGDGTGAASASRRSANAPAATLVVGQQYHIVAVVRGATDMELWLDGRSLSSLAYTGSGGALAYTNAPLKLGYHDAGPSVFQGTISSAMLVDGTRTPSTIRDLAADPLAPLRLRRQVYYSVPAAVGGNPWYYYAQQGAAVA